MRYFSSATEEVEAVLIVAEMAPRYWEDASVNGVEETDEDPQIPLRDGDLWTLRILIEPVTRQRKCHRIVVIQISCSREIRDLLAETARGTFKGFARSHFLKAHPLQYFAVGRNPAGVAADLRGSVSPFSEQRGKTVSWD